MANVYLKGISKEVENYYTSVDLNYIPHKGDTVYLDGDEFVVIGETCLPK